MFIGFWDSLGVPIINLLISVAYNSASALLGLRTGIVLAVQEALIVDRRYTPLPGRCEKIRRIQGGDWIRLTEPICMEGRRFIFAVNIRRPRFCPKTVHLSR